MTETDDKEKGNDEGQKPEETGTFLPPLDFSSIVFPFYTQALIQLGLMDTPDGSTKEENLELAKRLIDILDLLKDRTRGQLKPDEEKFLDVCLLQLKEHYLQKAKIINL